LTALFLCHREHRELRATIPFFYLCELGVLCGSFSCRRCRRNQSLATRKVKGLAASGVHPKTAQQILRHKDINLTMNVYTHVLHGQEAQAVASLPDMSLESVQTQTCIKSGTDDRDVTPKSLRKVYF